MIADTSKTDSIAQVYILLARGFSFPRASMENYMGEGQKFLKSAVHTLPFEMEGVLAPFPSLPLEELESFYITAFDPGTPGGPPCPLYEGLYRKDEGREGVMMELLRFYDYFDVKLQEKERDFPDHLATELEFMSHLSRKEAMAVTDGRDPQPFRIAQMDFLDRHLGKWVPLLNDRLNERVKEPFYQGISSLLSRFVEAHSIYLKGSIARGL